MRSKLQIQLLYNHYATFPTIHRNSMALRNPRHNFRNHQRHNYYYFLIYTNFSDKTSVILIQAEITNSVSRLLSLVTVGETDHDLLNHTFVSLFYT